MTISELIERLEEIRDTYGEDCEVRLMTQQNWPFENTIYGLTTSTEMSEAADDEDDCDSPDETVVYLVEGQQLGYGSKTAWECC